MKDKSPEMLLEHYTPINFIAQISQQKNYLIKDSCINIDEVFPSNYFFGTKNLKVIFIQRDNFDVAGSAKERWFKKEKSDLLYDQYFNFYLKILSTYISHKDNPNILWLNY